MIKISWSFEFSKKFILFILFLFFMGFKSCRIPIQTKADLPFVEPLNEVDPYDDEYANKELKTAEGFNHYKLVNFCSSSPFSSSILKSVYGRDDRIDYCEMKNRKMYLPYAVATGMMINQGQMDEVVKEDEENEGRLVKLRAQPLFKIYKNTLKYPICKNVRYKRDMVTSFCSGFALGKNIFVTAGHCLDTSISLGDIRIVFPIREDEKAYAPYPYKGYDFSKHQTVVENNQVYSISKILWRGEKGQENSDIAFLKLSRDFSFKSPYKIKAVDENKDGKISHLNKSLLMLGYPLGLNFKFNIGQVLKENSKGSIFTNLDAFRGNSGSPIIDKITGECLGILVRGNSDFVLNIDSLCYQEAKYSPAAIGEEEIEKVLLLQPFLSILSN